MSRMSGEQTNFVDNSKVLSSNGNLTSRMVAQPQKVLMQINKYVHPCERLPHFVKAEDLAEFALEYEKKENERIKEHLQTFDELIT